VKKSLFVIAWLLLSSIALAEIPRQITVQGRLTDPNDVPVPSVSYLFNFMIWDDLTSTNPVNRVWTEQFYVYVSNGLFNTFLSPPSYVNFDKPYYLEVRVGGNLLSPRVNITSSGYAFVSGGVAGNLDMKNYNISNVGLLGIGTASPTHRLNVVGDTNITGSIASNKSYGPIRGDCSVQGCYMLPNSASYIDTMYVNTTLNLGGYGVLTSASTAGGDLSGTFSNLQIGAGVVGTSELANGAVTNAKIANSAVNYTQTDSTQIQRRVSGTCAAGNYVRVVNQDGTVTCQSDNTGIGTSGWAVNGNVVYNDTATLQVAIGTASPSAHKLNVVGTANVTGASYLSTSYLYGNLIMNGNDIVNANKLYFSDVMLRAGIAAGYVSLRNTADTAFASIQGSTAAFYSNVWTPLVNYDDTITISTGGTNKNIILNPSGSVGIGTASPGAKLDVDSTSISGNPTLLEMTDTSQADSMSWYFTSSRCTGCYASGSNAGDLILRSSQTDDNFLITTDNGASTAFAVTSGGNVGIGTATPNLKLSVSKAAHSGESTNDANMEIYSENTGDANNYVGIRFHQLSQYWKLLKVNTNGFWLWDINSGTRANLYGGLANFNRAGNNYFEGNVGIGTASPNDKLEVEGAIRLNSSGDTRISFTESNSLRWDAAYSVAGNYLYFRDTQNSRDLLQLQDGGNIVFPYANSNVGIGTSSPAAKLSIALDGVASDPINYGNAIQITRAPASGQQISLIRSGNNVWSLGYDYNTNTFGIGQGQATDSNFAGSNIKFSIKNDGSVGIGTTNPGGTLDVNGRAGATSFKVFSTFGDLINNAPWYGIGQSSISLWTGYYATQLAGYYGLNFQTGNGQMVIRGDNGNVGIGTLTPTQKLEVSGNANISGGLTINSINGVRINVGWVSLPACDVNRAGQLTYYKNCVGTNSWTSYLVICMQTGESSYAWYTIRSNSWTSVSSCA